MPDTTRRLAAIASATALVLLLAAPAAAQCPFGFAPTVAGEVLHSTEEFLVLETAERGRKLLVRHPETAGPVDLAPGTPVVAGFTVGPDNHLHVTEIEMAPIEPPAPTVPQLDPQPMPALFLGPADLPLERLTAVAAPLAFLVFGWRLRR